MDATTLVEILDAAHLSRFVESPFGPRGGILLVGPPGNLKTTLIKCALFDYHDALPLSDINVQQLMVIRDDIASGRFHTLALYAMEKIYQRHSATASNVEGTLQAMVEEGFTTPAFEDPRRPTTAARCCVIGGITEALHRRHWSEWVANGFARRFLHCVYKLKDHTVLMDAIEKWEPLILNSIRRKWPSNRMIPMNLRSEDTKMIRNCLKFQIGETTPFQLALRIFAVLKWKYNETRARELFLDFAESLTQTGATLSLNLKEQVHVARAGK